MTWIRNLAQHPWRNAGLAVLIGVVSFVVASTALPQGNVPWTAIFWFLIPLIMLITAITLAVIGIRHRKVSTVA
jgi:amino acid transporter